MHLSLEAYTSLRYFRNFQICIFPVFHMCRIYFLMEMWKSDNPGNTEILQEGNYYISYWQLPFTVFFVI